MPRTRMFREFFSAECHAESFADAYCLTTTIGIALLVHVYRMLTLSKMSKISRTSSTMIIPIILKTTFIALAVPVVRDRRVLPLLYLQLTVGYSFFKPNFLLTC